MLHLTKPTRPFDVESYAETVPEGSASLLLVGAADRGELLARFPERGVDHDHAERATAFPFRGWESMPIVLR